MPDDCVAVVSAGRLLPSIVEERLADVALDPDTRAALRHFVEGDAAAVSMLPQLALPFAALRRAFAPATAAPFEAAWCLMYAAISRLDALQDGDPVSRPLPVAGGAAPQYNFVFAVYVLAEALLDDLPPAIPPSRIRKLRRLWSDTMLRMAAGQQRDLALGAGGGSDDGLEQYQQIAQAKTGASFALAFGGYAVLLTEDEPLIAGLTAAGEAYGTLLQYSDDLLDAAGQPNPALTLPSALGPLAQARRVAPTQLAAALWPPIYEAYRQWALAPLAGYPALHGDIAALFEQVFTGQR